ncbi:hypothetical protein [Nonomuraea sp. NPDC049709]|uniref:hypothetical protein n=1 Tax=Nonomuraea sp. NPDC049709 TaxID=3154736 RepID=UPI00341F16BE
MKTRILGAALGIAVLSGLLVASPAQARDGVASASVPPYRDLGGGSVRATVDFVSRKKVVVRNFTVRDICPGDNAPVKARFVWVHTDSTTGSSAWRKDTNGCGSHGTNFGNITRTGTKPIRKVYLHLEVGTRAFALSAVQDNQYT